MNTHENNRRLQELGGSDYEIADGQEDIRGWKVKNAEGVKLGDVDELIFEEESRKVRYIVLDMDGNELELDERKVMIPIGMAELDSDDDDVILQNVFNEQLRSLLEYDKDQLNQQVETHIKGVFSGSGSMTETDFYNDQNLYRNRPQKGNEDSTINVAEENLEIGKQEVETGGIRIRSRVTERPVEENINLREEHVTVERENVDRIANESDFAKTGESDIEIRERAEVPVVNKEARVVEEIKISKEVTDRDKTIHDTVRSTDVDVDNTSHKRNS